ncbi:MAG: imidazoleglycerol-phosphate dehydratase HisB [Candidatus Marinamargulisbacteria bacterium]
MTKRTASIERKTKETDIKLSLSLDGTGQSDIKTGIGFFDHMLDLFTVHGLFDLTVHVDGDLHVDGHHTVEDVGICLGQAIKASLGELKGITRYASGSFPMDDSLCNIAIDIGGRPFLSIDALPDQQVGAFQTELVEEFFRSVVQHAGLNLFISWPHKGNMHHVIEALFKGFGVSLDRATQLDARRSGVPSTKGVL